MESWIQDLRFAARMLATRPSFTLVAVLSLALGIGANTTIFSLVDALLLRSLPVADADRLVSVYTKDEKNPGFGALSHLNWKDYRAENRVFSGVLGYDWTPMSVEARQGKTTGEAKLAFGQLVSGNYFDLLGVEPALGRAFLPEEDGTAGAHPVAVVSHHFWEERLGSDPGAVGKTIRVNGSAYTVIGVAPAEFTGTDIGVRPALWIPMAMNRQIKPNDEINWYEERRGLFVNTIGRLKPGVTLAQARADLDGIARRLQQDYPADNKGRAVQLVPLTEAAVNPGVRGAVVASSTLLMVVVGLVLVIACANVANLLLARATARRKEIAIRLSQGAARGRVVRQLLTESVLLALLGGLGGLLLLLWARRALLSFLPTLPFPVDVTLDLGLDGRVLAFTLGVSLLTGFLFGLVPALQTSRPEMVSALKNETPPAAQGRRRFNVRNLLVVAQVALSLVSLIAAGLFLRSLGETQKIDPGFDPQPLAVLSFDAGLQGWDMPRIEQFFRDVRQRVGALPGVESVALAGSGPFQGSYYRSVFLEGGAQDDGTLIQVNEVGPGYLQTLGVPLVRGRAFDERDRKGSLPVVVINQTMAAKFWPGKDPVGRRFKFFGDAAPVQVVGVVRDIKYITLGEDPQPYIYQPLEQRATTGVTLIARVQRGDPAAVLPAIQRELRSMAPDMPLTAVSTVPRLLDDTLWAPRAGASLLALFGLLALVLAALGLYGVMSYSVTQRSREIGIRMALGAHRRDVLNLLLGQGMSVVGVGAALGLTLAFLATRFTASLLFGVSPTDPVAFGVTSALLAGVALMAILVPAQRATQVDPVVVLRSQ